MLYDPNWSHVGTDTVDAFDGPARIDTSHGGPTARQADARSSDRHHEVGEMARSADMMGPLLSGFLPISLEATNASARLLTRQENKYILDTKELTNFLAHLHDRFAVLEIDGKTRFAYSSCYFDDEFKCYYDHLQGKRLRFKVRNRCYVDTGDTFFEVKLRDARGGTNKKRIPTHEFAPSKLDEPSEEMLQEFFRKFYNRDFSHDIRPSIIISYKRVTLVSLTGGERMTIDYGLKFDPLTSAPIEIGDDFIIVECKSSDGKGIADGILKSLGKRSVKGCSKYCIGVILTGCCKKYNNFRRLIELVKDRIPTDPHRKIVHHADENQIPFRANDDAETGGLTHGQA